MTGSHIDPSQASPWNSTTRFINIQIHWPTDSNSSSHMKHHKRMRNRYLHVPHRFVHTTAAIICELIKSLTAWKIFGAARLHTRCEDKSSVIHHLYVCILVEFDRCIAHNIQAWVIAADGVRPKQLTIVRIPHVAKHTIWTMTNRSWITWLFR